MEGRVGGGAGQQLFQGEEHQEVDGVSSQVLVAGMSSSMRRYRRILLQARCGLKQLNPSSVKCHIHNRFMGYSLTRAKTF